ncbi:MAG: VOC family protein [Opitutaceae bacterium]
MEPRISIITLGVRNFSSSFRFYRDGLGFRTKANESDGIAWFETTSGVLLGLYPMDKLAEDIGADVTVPVAGGFSGITLAHNVLRKEDVATVLTFAAKAGGTIVKPAQDVFWGGHAGYFTDPDGYHWEVAWNPGATWDAAGNLTI